MAYAAVLCITLEAAERKWRRQNAAALDAARRKCEAAAGADAGGWDDGDEGSSSGRGGRQRGKAAAAAAGDGAEGGGSGSDVGYDLSTVTVGGVVASVDEELADPSFTLLPFDKARSQVNRKGLDAAHAAVKPD